jgi:hypothetical protein
MSLSYSKLDVRRAGNPDEIPSTDHWAILIFDKKSVYVEGDERSRTCPGHGYPAHTDVYETFEYWVVEDIDTLNKAVAYLEQEKREKTYSKPPPYAVIAVKKCAVKTEVRIEVG